ncbi:hypothetical protein YASMINEVIRUS_402 [Yasminevirus sp. GU-2018]|uniref:t-SNARE coiled-coil homology domain-containing protein n=1 Tax=Yasminevirus sp. GU-2018 TaxID=2420051 RepID=A0A5K0U7H8_9VIRU|nr:hypothetical protein YASMINEVIRUS_402 [Yasminevirus sp. GU-2018]
MTTKQQPDKTYIGGITPYGDLNDIEAEIKQFKEMIKADLESKKFNQQTTRQHISHLDLAIKEYNILSRDVPSDVSMHHTVRENIRLYKKELAELCSLVQNKIDSINKNTGVSSDTVQSVDGMSTDAVLQKALKVQDASITSTNNMLRQVEEARNIGANTLARLGDNTDRLRQIENGLDEVDDNLKIASKQLRSFGRRIATDKIIMCLACLVIVGIVSVVTLSLLRI